MKTFALAAAALIAATGASFADVNSVDLPATWNDGAYAIDYGSTAAIQPAQRHQPGLNDYDPFASKGERYGDVFSR